MTPSPVPQHTRDSAPEGLADALTVAVCVLDAEITVRYVNAAAEALFGAGRRRLEGHPLHSSVTLDADWLERIGPAIAHDRAFTVRELRVTPRYAAADRLVDATVTPWPGGGGEPAWAVVELVPIDRHRRIAHEASLEAQEAANRHLLRGVAHEIRNPLAGLRGAAQLLAHEASEPMVAEYTDVIINEVDRLQALVERMVGSVRAPQHTQLNLHEVTEHVLSLLRGQAPAGVTLTSAYDPSIPPLAADRDQLIQAVLNLGRNAVEAVGSQGTVVLRTYTLRQFTVRHVRHRLVAVIAVADDGPGIPAELAESLFQPMVTGRAQGSGLGLTIAQSLVGRHGGLIECEGSDRGSVFRMLLPLETGDD
jgi:two-component system nitrogen regulation sensor histidine kinase GlnL